MSNEAADVRDQIDHRKRVEEYIKGNTNRSMFASFTPYSWDIDARKAAATTSIRTGKARSILYSVGITRDEEGAHSC